MATIDTTKLRQIISDESDSDSEEMLYRDTFAVACYLHQIGKERAAVKLMGTLFDHLGRDRRTTYIADLFASLPANERKFADGIWAHMEINDLFRPLESLP